MVFIVYSLDNVLVEDLFLAFAVAYRAAVLLALSLGCLPAQTHKATAVEILFPALDDLWSWYLLYMKGGARFKMCGESIRTLGLLRTQAVPKIKFDGRRTI